MNLKHQDPTEVVIALLDRSICSVQVSALLVDKWGIYSWGQNHVGFDGLGQHAERECLRKANPKRLSESTLYIAARRRRNGHIVTARPCAICQQLIRRVGRTIYRDANGEWKSYA